MNRTQLTTRAQVLMRDFGGSTFRPEDIHEFINEAIERCQQVIPELEGMVLLYEATDVPILLPLKWQHLLAVYAAARCQFLDERHYQATQLMNEFEFKLEELKGRIEAGEETITDAEGNVVTNDNAVDFVETITYWGRNNYTFEVEDTQQTLEDEDIAEWFVEE